MLWAASYTTHGLRAIDIFTIAGSKGIHAMNWVTYVFIVAEAFCNASVDPNHGKSRKSKYFN